MGYDISFHPVDMRLVRERVTPFLAGHGNDDDLDDLIVMGLIESAQVCSVEVLTRGLGSL